MATYAYTFTSGDTVTPTKLNNARTVSDIVNADIKSDAAIAGTKVTPNFGSQNIVTTGSMSSGAASITGGNVSLSLVNSAASANQKIWDFVTSATGLQVRARNDAGGGGGNTFDFARSNEQVNEFSGSNSGNKWFVVDNINTRVGIGTTSPAVPLDFGSTDNREVIRIYNGGGSTVTGFGKYLNEFRAYMPTGDFFALRSGGPSGTERIRIDASGNVGIGTASLSTKLVVSGAGFNGGRATFQSTDSGNGITVSGVNGAGINDVAYAEFKDASNLAFIGLTGTNATAGALRFAVGTTSSTPERMRITAGGEVYIAGTTDQGAYNLQVSGTGVWGAGAYVNGSDERLKDNIAEITEGLEVVKKLRPVSFNYKPTHSKDTSKQAGFIAQELLVALEGKDYAEGTVQQGPEYYNVAYQNLIPVMAKAIQELSTKVEALEAAQ